jgi:hypothetical protein
MYTCGIAQSSQTSMPHSVYIPGRNLRSFSNAENTDLTFDMLKIPSYYSHQPAGITRLIGVHLLVSTSNCVQPSSLTGREFRRRSTACCSRTSTQLCRPLSFPSTTRLPIEAVVSLLRWRADGSVVWGSGSIIRRDTTIVGRCASVIWCVSSIVWCASIRWRHANIILRRWR